MTTLAPIERETRRMALRGALAMSSASANGRPPCGRGEGAFFEDAAFKAFRSAGAPVSPDQPKTFLGGFINSRIARVVRQYD
jgi:hypothetical protein